MGQGCAHTPAPLADLPICAADSSSSLREIAADRPGRARVSDGETAVCRKLVRRRFVANAEFKTDDAERRQDIVRFREAFVKDYVPTLASGKLERLPRGDLPYREAYQEILEFMTDPLRVFDQVQKMETVVMKTAEKKGITRRQAIDVIFEKEEKAGGFGKPRTHVTKRGDFGGRKTGNR